MRKLILVVFLFIAGNAMAQTWQDTVQKIEKLFEPLHNAPGAQLAISRNGELLFSKAWGMANLEHDVPLFTYSLTEAGSVSKQFVAACILLLEQQGKLSLEDDIRKYFPELPDYGAPVKLRHMMQHTSGLRDWGSVAALTGWPRSTKTYNNQDALQIISRQKALNNVPGAEYIYSNSNYNLFALLIERVSGLSLADYSRRYIFDPAGMKLSQWRDDFKRVVKNRATGYDPVQNGYETNMPNEYVYGNGGMLTTAEELLKWNHFYLAGKFGTPSLLEKQLYSYPFNNGNKNSYAAGLTIYTTNGWKDITHNGATAGYRADLHYFPDLGLSIAWLSNNAKPTNAVMEVINLFVPKSVGKEQAAAPVAFNIPANVIHSYAGWYRNERSGEGLELTMKDGSLMFRTQKLFPISNEDFTSGASKIHFTPKGFRLITGGNDTVFYHGVPPADPGPTAFQQYLGAYASEETESELTLFQKDEKLMVRLRPALEFELKPTYRDGFTSPAGAVFFERDKENRIIAMRISSGRARNVLFKRK